MSGYGLGSQQTNALRYFLSVDTVFHRKIMKSCGPDALPDRRTFDRRFKIIPTSQIIANMGNVFLSEMVVGCITASVDSMLLKAKGPVWHKSDMKKNRIPISGIDSIEPLFEIIKDTFHVGMLPVKGFENARSLVLTCVLLYQLIVYYNCVTEQENQGL